MKTELSREFGVEISKYLNEYIFFGNFFMTTSLQAGEGHQHRVGYHMPEKEALKVVHRKMGASATGIIASPFLWKIHPILGIISLFIGLFYLFDVREDWKAGKCENRICE